MSDLTPQALVIPEWLLARRDIGPLPRLVWAHIAMRQGRSDKAWPSVADIAQTQGIAEKTVRRSIVQLEAAGLLTVERVQGRGNVYSVTRVGLDSETAPLATESNGEVRETAPTPVRETAPLVTESRGCGQRVQGCGQRDLRNPSNNLSKNPPIEPVPRAREEVVRFDPVHPDERQRALRALIKRGFAEHTAGQVYPDTALPPERVRALAAWMGETAESRGHTWGAVALRTLDAWWLDEWAASKRWPFGHLAKHCARFEAPPRQPEGGEQLVGGMLAGSPGHVHEAALAAWEEPEWMRDEAVA